MNRRVSPGFCILVFAWSVSPLLAATYYTDFATGLAANTGLSRTAAWKVHPYMAGSTGAYTHHADDQFIFMGGVTWDHTCSQMDIAAGGSGACPVPVLTSLYKKHQAALYARALWQPAFDGPLTEPFQTQTSSHT